MLIMSDEFASSLKSLLWQGFLEGKVLIKTFDPTEFSLFTVGDKVIDSDYRVMTVRKVKDGRAFCVNDKIHFGSWYSFKELNKIS